MTVRGALAAGQRIVTVAWAVAVTALLASLIVVALLGWRIEVIETGSMAPAISPGSATLVAPVGPSEFGSLEVGDVISFRHPAYGKPVLHRIVEVVSTPSSVALRTQGDANDSPDSRLVTEDMVQGRLRASTPGLGSVLAHLRPPAGLLWLVGLPIGAAAVRSLVRRRQTDVAGSVPT